MYGFVDGEPSALAKILMWIYDKVADWHYRHWGHKRWTFGMKWNAMIKHLELEKLLKDKFGE